MKKYMYKLLALGVLILSLAVAAGCGLSDDKGASGQTITVDQKMGQTTVPLDPKRVVVLSYGALDSLDALGLGDRVVGVPSNYLPKYLEKYGDKNKYTNVGSVKDFDLEKISALHPDLIIISDRQQAKYNDLSAIAPTVYAGSSEVASGDDYYPAFVKESKMLGQIFQKEAEVDKALADLDAKIKGIQDQAAAEGKKGLVLMTTGGKVRAFGPGSRYAQVYNVAKLPSVIDAKDEGSKIDDHGQVVSFEYLATMNPDWILVLDRDSAIGKDGAAAKELLNTPLVNNTKAAQNGKIIYLEPTLWYLSGGGIESMNLELDELKQVF